MYQFFGLFQIQKCFFITLYQFRQGIRCRRCQRPSSSRRGILFCSAIHVCLCRYVSKSIQIMNLTAKLNSHTLNRHQLSRVVSLFDWDCKLGLGLYGLWRAQDLFEKKKKKSSAIDTVNSWACEMIYEPESQSPYNVCARLMALASFGGKLCSDSISAMLTNVVHSRHRQSSKLSAVVGRSVGPLSDGDAKEVIWSELLSDRRRWVGLT